MNIGMLWADGQGKLEERVARAAEYYKKKYGKAVTLVYANPADAEEGCNQVNGITVKKLRRIARNHLWVGVE